MSAPELSIVAVRWPEVATGDDLGERIIETADLLDGDVVVLTSKVVSKAAGRVVAGARNDWVTAETSRVVARRGDTVIAQTRHGLVLAAAGVDASNTLPGTVVLLPPDPDGTARGLRERIRSDAGRNVAVIITDTAGRAWRVGQTDLAIGCAGLQPVTDLRGTADSFGRRLDVTMPAIADELAAAADLVKGKVAGCPLAVVRGLAPAVLPTGEAGPGAADLIRAQADDLFGLGTREAAVAAALRGDSLELSHFPGLSAGEDVAFEAAAGSTDPEVVSISVRRSTLAQRPSWVVQVDVRSPGDGAGWFAAGQVVERSRTLAAAHRLAGADALNLAEAHAGWQTADCTRWRVA